jgi:hypothetical protein
MGEIQGHGFAQGREQFLDILIASGFSNVGLPVRITNHTVSNTVQVLRHRTNGWEKPSLGIGICS